MGQIHAEQQRHELLVAQSKSQSSHGRGNLRVKQRRGAFRHDAGQGFEVFAGAVHDAQATAIAQTCRQCRMRAKLRGIHERNVVIQIQLDQGEFGPEGVGAHELGVQPDQAGLRLRGDPGFQRCGLCDPLVH